MMYDPPCMESVRTRRTVVRTTSCCSSQQQRQTIIPKKYRLFLIRLWMCLTVVKRSLGLCMNRQKMQMPQKCFSINPSDRRRLAMTIFESKMNDHPNHDDMTPSPMALHHHTAIKTRNITMAISFYSLFGYGIEYKFRAGPARAAWLTTSWPPPHQNSRIELIEVPSYMLQSNKERAPDLLLSRPDILGYNHIAMDVTQQQQQEQLTAHQGNTSLTNYLQQLNRTSIQRFNKTLRLALFPPQQQMIGPNIYEIAFLYDADGALIELLSCTGKTQQNVTSGWEPWESATFR